MKLLNVVNLTLTLSQHANLAVRVFSLILYFFHPFKFPPLKLHDDEMEFCTLAQSLNPWSLSISMNLLYSLTPLFLGLGHRLAIFRKLTFNYRREIFLRKNL